MMLWALGASVRLRLSALVLFPFGIKGSKDT